MKALTVVFKMAGHGCNACTDAMMLLIVGFVVDVMVIPCRWVSGLSVILVWAVETVSDLRGWGSPAAFVEVIGERLA